MIKSMTKPCRPARGLSCVGIEYHTWDEGDGIFSTIFRRLEDVRLQCRIGWEYCQSCRQTLSLSIGIHRGRRGAVDCVDVFVAARSRDYACQLDVGRFDTH